MRRTVGAVIMDALIGVNATPFDITIDHDEAVAVAKRVVDALRAEGYLIVTEAS